MTRFHLLAITALLAMCVALAAIRAADATTPQDAKVIAWYLKGQTDVIFPAHGWTVEALHCTPRPGRFVRCSIRVDMPGRGVYCSHALYEFHGFGINGTASKPKPCGAPPA